MTGSSEVLSHVVRAYREYGLDINGTKTSVTRVIQHREEAWKSELGAFLSHRAGDLKGARLREFIALTLRLQSENEKQAVTNYALTVLEDLESMESFLLKSVLIAPGSMSRISELLLNIHYDTASLSKKRIQSRFVEIAVRALEKGDLYEALWLIFTLRSLKIAVTNKDLLDLAGETRSSALALVLLDMNSHGLIKGKLPTVNWERRINKDDIHRDWTWLLAYEGCRRGWLTDPAGLMTRPFFAAMNNRNVVFYDERRNVRKRTEMAKLRRAVRRKFQREVRQFLFTIRDVGFDPNY